MSRSVPVVDFVIGQKRFLQIEPVERHPSVAEFDFFDKLLANLNEPKGFMRSRLLTIGCEAKRSGQSDAAETDIGKVRLAFKVYA